MLLYMVLKLHDTQVIHPLQALSFLGMLFGSFFCHGGLRIGSHTACSLPDVDMAAVRSAG